MSRHVVCIRMSWIDEYTKTLKLRDFHTMGDAEIFARLYGISHYNLCESHDRDFSETRKRLGLESA